MMQNNDLYYELTEVKKELSAVKEAIDEVKVVVKSENDLWDNGDMVRYWKISHRTLATWRAEGLIEYVQVGSKIWYPREARERFLNSNLKEGLSHGRTQC